MKMPPQVRAVMERIDSMSIRERAMSAAAVLAVLWAVWDGMLMQPLSDLQDARQEQLASITQQVNELNRSIQSLAGVQPDDAGNAVRRQLAETRSRAIELDTQLRVVMRELVPMSEMAALLESMLLGAGDLELLGMQTLPPEPIIADDTETGYYRHGIQVDLRGSYLDALAYLQALENLRWRFLWDAVELEVVEHPASRIVITVHTLGERPGVIGV